MIAFALLCVVVLVATVVDFRTGKIPNRLTVPAFFAGLAVSALRGLGEAGLSGAWSRFGAALGAAAVALVLVLVVMKLFGGLGGGDLKLMAFVGAATASWRGVIDTLFYACVVAFVAALFVMVYKGIVRQTLQRLFTGVLMLLARTHPQFPEDSPRIPFAVGIAAGAILSGMQVLLKIQLPWPTFAG